MANIYFSKNGYVLALPFNLPSATSLSRYKEANQPAGRQESGLYSFLHATT